VSRERSVLEIYSLVDGIVSSIKAERHSTQDGGSSMSKKVSKAKRAVVVIEEAAKKRVRQLSIEEPHANANEVYVVVLFDDDTQLYIDLSSRQLFGVQYLEHIDGELEPVKTYPVQSLHP
jgi:hypothetical protein